jgi:hypothetical protein
MLRDKTAYIDIDVKLVCYSDYGIRSCQTVMYCCCIPKFRKNIRSVFEVEVILKTEAGIFSETLLSINKTAWCHNPEDHDWFTRRTRHVLQGISFVIFICDGLFSEATDCNLDDWCSFSGRVRFSSIPHYYSYVGEAVRIYWSICLHGLELQVQRNVLLYYNKNKNDNNNFFCPCFCIRAEFVICHRLLSSTRI